MGYDSHRQLRTVANARGETSSDIGAHHVWTRRGEFCSCRNRSRDLDGDKDSDGNTGSEGISVEERKVTKARGNQDMTGSNSDDLTAKRSSPEIEFRMLSRLARRQGMDNYFPTETGKHSGDAENSNFLAIVVEDEPRNI